MDSKTEEKNKNDSGIKELLYDGYYYDVTNWIKKHPGGKIIEFYTQNGEDSTQAVQQFHNRSTKKVMGIMNSLKKRPAGKNDYELDPVAKERHRALANDFLNLFRDLQGEGFFEPSPLHVVYRISELLAFLLFGLFLISFQIPQLTFFGIVSLALYQGRSGWLMHEGGHHSLTGIPNLDRFIQMIVYGVGNGMSSSWWSSQHNRHHAMPQRIQRDVDLNTLPFLAFNSKVVKKPKDGQGFFIQNQALLFVAIDTFLVAFFWKLFLHPKYALNKGKYLELLFMGIHYLVIPYQIGYINYFISVWLASVYIFGNFALSHTHLPVTTAPTHWVDYALIHTADVQPCWYIDWWMGYLNYQIEHHLFPTMPQFRSRRIQERVKALALKHNIPYLQLSYYEAMKKTFSNLFQVSKELRH